MWSENGDNTSLSVEHVNVPEGLLGNFLLLSQKLIEVSTSYTTWFQMMDLKCCYALQVCFYGEYLVRFKVCLLIDTVIVNSYGLLIDILIVNSYCLLIVKAA